MNYLDRIEKESDQAYVARLRCSLRSMRPLDFDEGLSFLKEFNFITSETKITEVREMIANLNANKSWEQYNRAVAIIEQLGG